MHFVCGKKWIRDREQNISEVPLSPATVSVMNQRIIGSARGEIVSPPEPSTLGLEVNHDGNEEKSTS